MGPRAQGRTTWFQSDGAPVDQPGATSGGEQSAWNRLPGSHHSRRTDRCTLCCWWQHLLRAGLGALAEAQAGGVVCAGCWGGSRCTAGRCCWGQPFTCSEGQGAR
uniref:Uncharacterized protein n=1 Tax=Myotis myotis TaxID=51298 RepID=A0A7J7QZ57_MYOMY|nr:hypothetical protein mMyoMyo1_011260 [Myotis myotis]